MKKRGREEGTGRLGDKETGRKVEMKKY